MFGRPVHLFLLAGLALCSIAWAQVALPGKAPAPASTSPPSPPPDTLGRDTPRGCVLGFLDASRKGDYENAKRYLNIPLRGPGADDLARQLSLVLDRKLPARLNLLSLKPEGSLYYADRPDADFVGTIETLNGTVDIVVQRVDRGKNGVVWLFSKETLAAIPEIYDELTHVSVRGAVPAFLTEFKILDISLFQWLAVLVGMPLVYVLTGLLDALVSPLASRGWRKVRKQPGLKSFRVIPPPVRLLLLVLVIRWTSARLSLSLLTRQSWSIIATIVTITATVWLVLEFNSWAEERLRRRFERRRVSGAVSILRLARRSLDIFIVFAGFIAVLTYFKLNVSAALAGLGVGGIAIALAAQKTLENVIGGVSIIADRVVRVGDFLKIGTTIGTVEDIGLRSTRIRTLDRSLVSIPNGQISNERLEDMSRRDKFWFHPVLSLRYETTAAQLRTVLGAIRSLLLGHARVERDSVRVRFLCFGSSSLDIDVFAYVSVLDYADFLEVQEELLLHIMDAVQAAGTRMAFPSQTTYLATDSPFEEAGVKEMLKLPARQ